jgi:FixJ family two-component response regulator
VITDLIVAVVDDEPPLRTMLGRVLRMAGYRVALFAAGEELLAALQSQPLACVVLDVHMPGLTGLEVHARLRAARCDVPVIFVTASDDAELDGATRKLAASLLRKPFSSDELVRAVGVAIADHQVGA